MNCLRHFFGFCLAVMTVVSRLSGADAVAVPVKGAYFGAYVDFGETEDEVTLEGIERFERLAGKHAAIVASSSYWGEQTFPAENVRLIARHGSIPLVYWSPWDRPYEERTGPDRFSLDNIISGKWDDYIDRWASGARAFGRPLMVSFCNEMNGDWFPWSGTFNGGGKEVPGSNPPRFEGPETFKKAWRHVVERCRAKGANNILWVFHANNYGSTDAWNQCAQYYPGSEYVDWLGLSVYGKQFSEGGGWADFFDLVDWPYREICEVDSTKPVMLAEYGVGEFPKSGSKAGWFRDALTMMKSRWPRLKAAVYWNERWQNANELYSNLRINSSAPALEAFRAGIADPYWLSSPLFSNRAKIRAP